jgi:hypothetical protein
MVCKLISKSKTQKQCNVLHQYINRYFDIVYTDIRLEQPSKRPARKIVSIFVLSLALMLFIRQYKYLLHSGHGENEGGW